MAAARRLFARTLEAPGGLRLQTVHAFCEALLKRFPVEAGLPPHFQVADEAATAALLAEAQRSEEHTSELQSLMRISYAVFCLKKKKQNTTNKETKCTLQ